MAPVTRVAVPRMVREVRRRITLREAHFAPLPHLRMPSLSHPMMLPAALATVAVVTASLLFLSRNAAMKRRLAPLLMATLAIVVLALVLVLAPVPDTILSMIVGTVAAALVFAMLRTARFCDACGHTILPRGLVRSKECPRCGDDLHAQAGARCAGIAREPMRRMAR